MVQLLVGKACQWSHAMCHACGQATPKHNERMQRSCVQVIALVQLTPLHHELQVFDLLMAIRLLLHMVAVGCVLARAAFWTLCQVSAEACHPCSMTTCHLEECKDVAVPNCLQSFDRSMAVRNDMAALSLQNCELPTPLWTSDESIVVAMPLMDASL